MEQDIQSILEWSREGSEYLLSDLMKRKLCHSLMIIKFVKLYDRVIALGTRPIKLRINAGTLSESSGDLTRDFPSALALDNASDSRYLIEFIDRFSKRSSVQSIVYVQLFYRWETTRRE